MVEVETVEVAEEGFVGDVGEVLGFVVDGIMPEV